jgi:hypothetical protein
MMPLPSKPPAPLPDQDEIPLRARRLETQSTTTLHPKLNEYGLNLPEGAALDTTLEDLPAAGAKMAERFHPPELSH